jgi:Dockerin type I domain
LIDIEGPGATSLTVARSSAAGTPGFGIFTVDAGANVKLAGLTIIGGIANDGGGINNSGTLTVASSTIAGNFASNGGGIINSGTLTVTNSTIANNSTVGRTILLDPRATYLHTNSDPSLNAQPVDLASLGIAPGTTITLTEVGTFDASGGQGDTAKTLVGVFSSTNVLTASSDRYRVPGAIDAGVGHYVTTPTLIGSQPTDIPQDFLISDQAVHSITLAVPAGAEFLFFSPPDSYFGDNVDPNHDFGVQINSGGAGGGIWNSGTLTTVNTTIAYNVAGGGAGGGLDVFGGTATLNNTILALNTDGLGSSATPDDISLQGSGGTVSTGSAYNLIGTGGSGGLINGTKGNHVGVTNPGLAPVLAGHGGPTQTIALLQGSPAIDAGSNELAVDAQGHPLTTDQRGSGFLRVVNHTVDIGAFEVQAASQLVVTTQPPSRAVVDIGFGLVVSAEDPYGNVDPNFGGSVAVALSNNPGGATLGGTLTATAQSGVATFSGLMLDKPGIGYTLKVSTSGLSDAITGAFNVQTTIATVAVGWGSQAAALQTAADGLRLLPAGRNTDMPWVGINQVPITLAQATTLAPSDVTIKSARGINYGPVSISGSGTSYVITLAQPISAADRVTLTIGNALVASFTRRLDVLPGDFNDDGVVDSRDVVGVRNEFLGFAGAAPTLFGDINGDGKVDINDYNAVRKLLFMTMPPIA